MFGEGVKLAGYHLQALGVIPSHWRYGIGRALIEIGEEKVVVLSTWRDSALTTFAQAKAQKVCSCIETVGISAVRLLHSISIAVAVLMCAQVGFYARMGYEVKPPKLYASVTDPNNENVPLYGFIKTWA